MGEGASEFGGELRRLRAAAGLSLRGLAARVHYSKGYLSKVENGRARANPDFARACDTVLDADGALVALAGAAAAATGAGISGLPLRTPHFTGRERELAQIEAALLGEAIGCVLTGMAGVGKTALAVRAAGAAQSRFPDGCLFLDLRGYPSGSTEVSSDEALDRLLRVLGVPGAAIPSDQDGRANLYRDRLRGKRMLLVFDNVRGTGQVAPLLPAEPRCRVIITSRNRLNALDDAAQVPVGELATAEAVALFRSVVGDDERMPAGDEPVAAVVEYCGRLPLAVRIAAARFRSRPLWTFEEFARRLSDEAARLGALDDGERSVAAAFALSYQLLSEPQRRMFGLLALHPGRDIATHSAAALAGLDLAAAEQVLSQLADAHLIIERAGGYHQFHDLVRMFATEHALAEVPNAEREAAVTRLLDLALARTRACDELLAPQRYRPEPIPGTSAIEGFAEWDTALSWLDVEWPNLVALCRTAGELGQHERCWRLALLLRDFFFRTKLWDPWIETHRHAAASAMAAGNTVAVAMTVNNLGMAYTDRGDLDLARDNHQQALALFREAGDDNGATVALSNLAWVNLYLGQHEIALRDLAITLESYRRAGSARNAAITLRGIALAETELGAFTDALRHAEQARDEFAGAELDAAMALNCIAWVHYRAGRHQVAASHYRRAAVLGERGRSPFEVARARTGLGNIAATAGHRAEAAEHWAEATRLHPGLSPVTVGEAAFRRTWEERRGREDVGH